MIKSDKTSRETLIFMIDYIITTLDELYEPSLRTDYVEGERTAFVECLEMLSMWEEYWKYGIANIEEIYPVK